MQLLVGAYQAILLSPAEWANQLVYSAGYGGIALALVVDSAGVPIPSEVVLSLTGVLIRQGRFSLAVVLPVVIVAQFVGAQVAYEIGRRYGVRVVARYGRYVLLNQRELDSAARWFERFGGWATLVGRDLPLIRSYVAYPAGAAGFSRARFTTANAVSVVPWTAFFLLLGYSLGGQVANIDHFFQRFSIVILVIVIGAAATWYIKHRRRP